MRVLGAERCQNMPRRVGEKQGKKATVRSTSRSSRKVRKPGVSSYLETSPYTVDAGEKIGKIPTKISKVALKALQAPSTPIKAIRARCLDCSGGQHSEVRKCVAFDCPSWAYRMGDNPFDKRSKVR